MNKKNLICKFCNIKINILIDNNFMEYKNNYYHFNCVCNYGYNKFCIELLYEKNNLLKEKINN